MSRKLVDRRCASCRLSGTRTQVVPGTGDAKASLVIVGEAPGKDEDREGAPFVGRAGAILDNALAHAGTSRDCVYITNLVKCRPPANRRPRADEVEACRKFLDAELRVVRPKVVCLLGLTVARSMLGDRSRMRDIAGSHRTAVLGGREVNVFVSYHPASCLYTKENVESLNGTMRLCVRAAGLA